MLNICVKYIYYSNTYIYKEYFDHWYIYISSLKKVFICVRKNLICVLYFYFYYYLMGYYTCVTFNNILFYFILIYF